MTILSGFADISFWQLALVAGVTDKLILGTGSLIPHRQPVLSALALSSLEFLAGPGRVIAGWGTGFNEHEFQAAGLGGIKRRALLIDSRSVRGAGESTAACERVRSGKCVHSR